MNFFIKNLVSFQKPKFNMSMFMGIQFFTLCAISLTGCSSTAITSNTPIISESQTFNAIQYDSQNASKAYIPAVTEEVFRPGDKVTVTVNGFKEFSGVYNLDKSGNIFLGHIGHLKAAGLTIPALQQKLHQEYNSCCLINPNISIEREGQAFGKIVVDGAVNDAGIFEIDEVIRLSQAVALSGGLSDIADSESVMLSRIIDGERKVSQINLKNIQLAGAFDPAVYPNDVIYVQDSKGRMLYNDFIKTVPVLNAVIYAITRR